MSRNTLPNPNAVALAELLSDEELADLLGKARAKKQNAEKSEAVNRITELLRNAEESLREAGRVATENQIQFTFVTPKGVAEGHSGWMDSACYASDGWFFEDSYRQSSSVNGVPINPETEQWQSSSYNC